MFCLTMKAIVILCFLLLSCVSALVGAKSIKSKHENELNRSETKEFSEKEQPNGEVTDAQKEADANKCTCEIPTEDNQEKSKCADKCECLKQDTEKCEGAKKTCNCNPRSTTERDTKCKDCQCKAAADETNNNSNATKKCNCKCNARSNTAQAAFAQMSDDPGVLAVAPLSPQANGAHGMRKGKGSKKCCCCDCCHDCCHDCCCHDCCCHCCEPCCCCCHCCEPCCCHECCCPCCCHCCHCCPCCCHHCCCKKSKSSEQKPQAISPLIAGEHAKPQHH